MPPRVWLPNIPMRLRLFPPPKSDSKLPAAGVEGTFRTNEIVVETQKSLTKIEAKRILEAVYGIEVESVHSLIRMGKRRAEHTKMPYQKKDYKRFYVRLTSNVDLPNVPKGIEHLSNDDES